MTPAERIRVFIAGDIYPKRDLVRRFLEDDGYDVVGTTVSRKGLMAGIRKYEPDAVVVDEDLLLAGAAGGTVARVREAVPDAKVIVFTGGSAGGASKRAGADGYLEKGVGLSALTALLGRVFVDEPGRIEQPATGGATADIAASAPSVTHPRERVPAAASNGNGVGATARLVAIASGAILVVWGMIALLASGGGPTPPPVDRTEGNGNGELVFDSAMEDAQASLRRLIGAIESGNYVLASIEAETLLDARERAKEQGFSIARLDATITARLGTVVDLVPRRAGVELSSILGILYPDLSDEEVPVGGSDSIFGPTPGGATNGDTSAGETGGGSAGDGIDIDGDGTGGDGTVGTGGESGEEPTPVDDTVEPTALGPGDGRAWGQSHKQRHEAGILPPWANGNAVGHTKPGHDGPHGMSGGHQQE